MAPPDHLERREHHRVRAQANADGVRAHGIHRQPRVRVADAVNDQRVSGASIANAPPASVSSSTLPMRTDAPPIAAPLAESVTTPVTRRCAEAGAPAIAAIVSSEERRRKAGRNVRCLENELAWRFESRTSHIPSIERREWGTHVPI
ncbi:MAG TPA: hypothetical protein VFJ16_13060 [Longimicrobium sp.]|nr:hypothetical protein [Longimicrobium sp.]